MIPEISPALHTAAHLVTLRVIESLVEGTLIALFAGVIIRSRQNSGSRFAVWFSSLVAIAVLPLFAGGWLGTAAPASATSPAVTVPDSWAFYLLAIWAVIATWLLVGVGRSLWHLRTIRKSCVEIDPAAVHASLRDSLRQHRGNRDVALCTSSLVNVPTALGLLKPAVVIPEWLVRELTTEELNQILLHELAHLRRWDDCTNLAQQVIKAVFFFHPAVWWIEKKVALEREMACDDAVLAETGSPRLYAECLARLAEKSFVQRTAALAQAALGRVRQISVRVRRILDPQRSFVPTSSLKPAVSLIAVFAMACGVWSVRASRWIGFEDGTQVQARTASNPQYEQDSASRFGVKAIPAVVQSSQIPGITQARLKLHPAVTKQSNCSAKTQARPARPAPRPEQLVHAAKAKITTIPVTETVFVVIEDNGPNSAGVSGYQIQMWRLTVFHTFVPSAQISRKQI